MTSCGSRWEPLHRPQRPLHPRPRRPLPRLPELAARNRALLRWYDLTGRDLPWRTTRDRWAILVSEVMLQQTQVARVIPVYLQFMSRFPTPGLFAATSPSERIDAWGDLGYLRRVRHLHAAATRIDSSGWPEALTDLPGVGPYTAAAVGAFADGEPVAAIDVNLRRILSRWHGEVLSPRDAHRTGAETIDTSRPADWNQAMMDLGAIVCRRRSPRCAECPVAEWCMDPTIVISAGRQSQFEGSIREARAAILKHLAAGHQTRSSILATTGLDPATLDEAVSALVAEGTIWGSEDALALQ